MERKELIERHAESGLGWIYVTSESNLWGVTFDPLQTECFTHQMEVDVFESKKEELLLCFFVLWVPWRRPWCSGAVRHAGGWNWSRCSSTPCFTLSRLRVWTSLFSVVEVKNLLLMLLWMKNNDQTEEEEVSPPLLSFILPLCQLSLSFSQLLVNSCSSSSSSSSSSLFKSSCSFFALWVFLFGMVCRHLSPAFRRV